MWWLQTWMWISWFRCWHQEVTSWFCRGNYLFISSILNPFSLLCAETPRLKQGRRGAAGVEERLKTDKQITRKLQFNRRSPEPGINTGFQKTLISPRVQCLLNVVGHGIIRQKTVDILLNPILIHNGCKTITSLTKWQWWKLEIQSSPTHCQRNKEVSLVGRSFQHPSAAVFFKH